MSVRIRFYGRPLLSCVLVTLGVGDAARRVLTGSGLGVGATVDDADVRVAVQGLIEDLRSEPTPLVVMPPHNGRSVAGAFAANGWAEAPVGEVWLPRTEGPDPVAVEEQKSLSGRADRLAAMLDALASRESTNIPRQIVDSCRRDPAAMRTLLEGWPSATIRFLARELGQRPDSNEAAHHLDAGFEAGSAQVRVLRLNGPDGRAPAVHLPDTWQAPFSERYQESQRRYVTRNLRAKQDIRMNLRTLGKVAKMSGLQPLALALSLQQQHHGGEVLVHVRVGTDNLFVLGDHQLDGTTKFRTAMGPRRRNSTEVMVCTAVSGSSPVHERMDAVVDVNGLVETRPGLQWEATVAHRWTEWALGAAPNKK